jgi:hypothetical protein
VVDVWIPDAVTPINRVGAPLCTWEEGLAHIQENRIRFQRGKQNDNKRKNPGASLERIRIAIEK